MFSRHLADRIRIELSMPHHAEEIFALTDRNRIFLRQWLPWLDAVTTVQDTRNFLNQQIRCFAEGASLQVAIFYDDAIAGVGGFNTIDRLLARGRVQWQRYYDNGG